MGKIGIGLFLGLFIISGSFKAEAKSGEWKKRVKKELNLSEEQLNKVTDVKAKYKKQLKDLASNKKELRKELAKMTRTPDKSEAFKKKLTQKHNELQSAMKELQDKRFEMMLETRGLLKPDQIAKMDKLFKKRGQKYWDKKKKRQAQKEDLYLEGGN